MKTEARGAGPAGGHVPDLFSSQGLLVQDMAYSSLSASEAKEAFLNMDQAKSHSSAPPAAMALQ